MTRFLRFTVPFAVTVFLAAMPAPARAQRPPLTPEQIETLRRNPDLIRQYIRTSGLTPDQIRARLRAAGYPDSLLDPYFTGDDQDALGAPGTTEMEAIQALDLPFWLAERILGVDSGLVSASVQPTRIFGVEAFRRSTTQFLPVLAGPVPSGYRLGPGDVLVLILTGDVELTHTLPVTREGFVLIPQVGQVFVTNLTLDQLRDQLYSRLGRVYSGVRRGAAATTRFDVSVSNVRANQVYVVGEVTQPGAYQLSALGTVLTALYAAGGVTERANLRAIELRRDGAVVDSLDLYDYLLRGDTRGDARLETGDIVFVDLHGPRVAVEGAVVRPGIFEIVPGESLADALEAAGGFRPDAELARLTVHRLLPLPQRGPGLAARSAISVSLAPSVDTLAQIWQGAVVPPFTLADGDSISVDSLPPLGSSLFVYVAGMVQRPGRFPWRAGITLRDLVTLAGGVRVGADLREAELARMPVGRSSGQLATAIRVPLDSSYLNNRDASGRYPGPPGPVFPPAGSAAELALEPFDQVLILKQPEFEPQRTVTIAGEVLYPGAYTLLRKDERLSSLVQRAGGLLPTAYPAGTRFFRAVDEAGRVNVDLPRILADPGNGWDVVLQPGDSIEVPEFNPTVHVHGAVNSPTSVLYREGADLDYYIANAGGYARNADKGRVSVRYANGSARVKSRFLFFASSPATGPGSVVSVPEKPEGGGVNVTQLLAAAAQILASTVAIIVVATR